MREWAFAALIWWWLCVGMSGQWMLMALFSQVLESSAGMLLHELLPLKWDSLCKVFPHLSPSELRKDCHSWSQVVPGDQGQVCHPGVKIAWEHAPSLPPSV